MSRATVTKQYVRNGCTVTWLSSGAYTRLAGAVGAARQGVPVSAYLVTATWHLTHDDTATFATLYSSLPFLMEVVLDLGVNYDGDGGEMCYCWIKPNTRRTETSRGRTVTFSASFVAVRQHDLEAS